MLRLGPSWAAFAGGDHPVEHLPLTAAHAGGNPTLIPVGNLTIGRDFLVIAGPCAIESEEQMMQTAAAVKAAGANMLRGGVEKPRTSPYAFRGLGRQGLAYLSAAGRAVGLPVVTEVLDPRDMDWIVQSADVLQIGARNMQNFPLLVEAGRTHKPVILKRGLSSTLAEWLASAEYIMNAGNPQVMLCERGIRTFETYTRNTMDIGAIAALKQLTHLPVLADPSHGTGRAELVAPMALSAIWAGCDGMEIEVHPAPQEALSDPGQQLTPAQFQELMGKVRQVLAWRKALENGSVYSYRTNLHNL